MLNPTSSLIHSLYPPIPLPPSCRLNEAFLVSLFIAHPCRLESHLLSLKPSRSYSSLLVSDPDPQKPLGERSLKKWICFSVNTLRDPYPQPFALLEDIFHKKNVFDVNGSAVL